VAVIAPFGVREHRISAVNFRPGEKLVLAAVIFDDGDWAGDEKIHKKIQDMRARSKAKRGASTGSQDGVQQ
jgi:hypothetical protein